MRFPSQAHLPAAAELFFRTYKSMQCRMRLQPTSLKSWPGHMAMTPISSSTTAPESVRPSCQNKHLRAQFNACRARNRQAVALPIDRHRETAPHTRSTKKRRVFLQPEPDRFPPPRFCIPNRTSIPDRCDSHQSARTLCATGTDGRLAFQRREDLSAFGRERGAGKSCFSFRRAQGIGPAANAI